MIASENPGAPATQADAARPSFEYTARAACFCGATLRQDARTMVKESAWGCAYFVECPECGSWCQSPRITPASLAAWYSSPLYLGSEKASGAGYANYLSDEGARLAEAQTRARELAGWLPAKSHVLEVGCGTGSLLRGLRDAGHVVRGIDISPSLCDFARVRHGLDVYCSDVMSAQVGAESLDAVLMFGTVSNLQGLEARLATMLRWLKPRGLLIFNFVDAESQVARLYGRKYWMFTPSVDTFLSGRGCLKGLERCGFEPVRMTIDRQRPSLQKLAKHAKLHFALPLLSALHLGGMTLPLALPIPGVRFVVARRQ